MFVSPIQFIASIVGENPKKAISIFREGEKYIQMFTETLLNIKNRNEIERSLKEDFILSMLTAIIKHEFLKLSIILTIISEKLSR